MKFEDYVSLAMRTKRGELSQKDQLLNACLGLIGEYAEYQTAGTPTTRIEELGDIYWYVALLSDANNFNRSASTPNKKELVKVIGNIADDVKKHVYQGHKFDNAAMNKKIIGLLVALHAECKKNGTTPATVMQLNVSKLKKRYPQGFTVDSSVNRLV